MHSALRYQPNDASSSRTAVQLTTHMPYYVICQPLHTISRGARKTPILGYPYSYPRRCRA